MSSQLTKIDNKFISLKYKKNLEYLLELTFSLKKRGNLNRLSKLVKNKLLTPPLDSGQPCPIN